MQVNNLSRLLSAVAILILPFALSAQVNTVEFGKNRIQYKKLKWKFYQSQNFNTYTAQGGTELGKFVAQVAEDELPSIETFMEYSLQRRVEIVVYTSYDEFRQSNIGLGIDWQNAGGLTKLVNNKIVVYFDGDHSHMRHQIRQGIARVLLDNQLFGDDLGEIASNQALLDLPKWLTDGYVAYVAENWSTEKDDELKNVLLGADYKNFYQFAFDKPLLAGHAFWNYFAAKYKKENVPYFLYLSRIYKSLNHASQKICKKKFKEVLSEFMDSEQDRFYQDLRSRKNNPKGQLTISEDVSKDEYYRFQINPNPKSFTYAVVEFRKGIYSVKLNENLYDTKVLLKRGVKTYSGDINPNYPILAWDGKGTRLLVIYWEGGKTKMFVYDILSRYKRNKQEITDFDQILDATFMLDANTLVLSAVKNGHSDIFIYKIEEQKVEQVTDDIYDDLNPTFVSFPNKSGIIFSSNRPGVNAPNNDTVLPSKYKFNIFMVDILNKAKGSNKQITQLSDVKQGNATHPMQYNTNHFTFLSDANGIANRWAGFFSTQRNGLDTLYYVGDELLRNPTPSEMDSTLAAWRKDEPDSVSYFQVYKDSTYTFPITNYQSSIQETRIAGNNGLVSEVRREGDYKFLYKLKVDENALNRRNVNPKPTNYMKGIIDEQRKAAGLPTLYEGTDKKGNKKSAGKTTQPVDTAKKKAVIFQSEFEGDKPDTSAYVFDNTPAKDKPSSLKKMKLFNYRYKFSADYVLAGVSNNVLINRYQPYNGGYGPVQLNNGNDFNWSLRAGISDVFEDIKLIGGLRFGSGSLSDKDAFLTFQNNRKRLDWGATYYRSTQSGGADVGGGAIYPVRLITNLYQGNISYPFDEARRIQITLGLRTDRYVFKAIDQPSAAQEDLVSKYGVGRIEYIYDNTQNPAQNIWNGLRWKIYFDINMPVGATSNVAAKTYNAGFDARHYLKIYRNFIWAVRAAGDFSFGTDKLIYYLGGVDGWINPKFNSYNTPDPTQNYAFQSLAVNMRGFNQNVANGNNALVINSEFRLPVFSTFLNSPINNAFIRNFQLVQFIDLGTAWSGSLDNIKRPTSVFQQNNNPVSILKKAGGIGPLAGGYGFGARSTLLGYFLKLDCAWEMNGVFKGKPILYFALGLDF